MNRSLRFRLIFGMLVGMVVVLVAAGATIYTVQRRQLHQAVDENLLNGANSLPLLIHRGPVGYWLDARELARLSANQLRSGAVYQIWSDQPIDVLNANSPGEDAEGDHPEPSSQSRPPRPGRRESPEEWRRREPGTLVIRSSLLDGADLPRLDASTGAPRFAEMVMPDLSRGRAVGLMVSIPASGPGPGQVPGPELGPGLGPGPHGLPPATLTVVVAASTAEIETQLGFLAALLVVTAVGTMGFVGGVAWLVVSRGLRPLEAVAGEIAALDERGLKERIASAGIPKEIEPVVRQLNALLGRLDGALERERGLTADIAHELRTPVAEIRAIADVTLSRTRDPGDNREALGEIGATVATLQGLIEKLLTLARLEAGQVKPAVTAIALRPAVVEHWNRVAGAAQTRGVTFEETCAPDTCVAADPALLDTVLANVMSNAATYTPSGGRIVAVAKSDEEVCRLTVSNPGWPLDAGKAQSVFERFWRADETRATSGLNCGLGLTLVKRAMEAMNGTADAKVNEEGWFVLELRFQRAEVEP